MEHEIKDLNEKKIGAAEYAPKRRSPDLTELENAMKPLPPAPTLPPPYPYNQIDDSVNRIKAEIKKLTHRQMRDMCKTIFEAHSKIDDTRTNPGISVNELPDVLDRFAHGD